MTNVDPRLRAVFESLNEADVRWAVIRDGDALEVPVGEIDLVVDRADRARMTSVLRGAGFTKLLLFGYGPRAQFIRFDTDASDWLKLDVVWRIEFGRRERTPTNLAEGCIARRQREGSVVALDRNDQFWLLLLHCLLDKEAISERHLRSLRRLRPDADADSETGVFCTSLVGHQRTERLTRAIDHGNHAEFDEVGREAKQVVVSRVVGRLQLFCSRIARKAGSLIRGPLRRGVVVVAIGSSGGSDLALLREIEAHSRDPFFRTKRYVWHRPARGPGNLRLSAWIQRARIWGLCRSGWIVLLEGFDSSDIQSDRHGLPDQFLVLTGGDAPWLGEGDVPTFTVDSQAPGPSAVAVIEGVRGAGR